MFQKSETIARNQSFMTDFSKIDSLAVSELTFASQVLIFIVSEADQSGSLTNHICGAIHADLSTTKTCVRNFRRKFESYAISRHIIKTSRNRNFLGLRRCFSLNDQRSLRKSLDSRSNGPGSIPSSNHINSGISSTLPRAKQKKSPSSKVSLQNCPTLTNSGEVCSKIEEGFSRPIFTRAMSSERVQVRKSSINGHFLQSLSDIHNRSLTATPTQLRKSNLRNFRINNTTGINSILPNSKNESRAKLAIRESPKGDGVTRSLSLQRKKFVPNSLHVEVLSSRIRQTSECSGVTDGDSGVVSDTNSISETTQNAATSLNNNSHIKSNQGSDATLTPNDTLNTVDLDNNHTSEQKISEFKLDNLRAILFHKDGIIFDCFAELLRDLPDIEIHHFPLIEGKKTRILVRSNCSIDFEIIPNKDHL